MASVSLEGFDAFEEVLVKERFAVRDIHTGEPLERSYSEVVERIIRTAEEFTEPSAVESLPPLHQAVFKTFRTRFFDSLKPLLKGRFIIPSTPVSINFGGLSRHPGLFACYPLGECGDSLREIFTFLSLLKDIFKSGGGAGIDCSALRPRGAPVDNMQGHASGPASFANLFTMCAHEISQGSRRRGALMLTCHINHPDVVEFFTLKQRHNFCEYLRAVNISVLVETWDKIGGELYPSENLRRRLAESIWRSGDPGVFFLDNVKKESVIDLRLKPFYSNPCGEYLSVAFTACNLFTVNALECAFKALADSVSPKEVVPRLLENIFHTARTAAAFGNLILFCDFGYPTRSIAIKTQRLLRPIGVGLTGLHEVLILLGLKYSSEEGRELAAQIWSSLLMGTLESSTIFAQAVQAEGSVDFVELDDDMAERLAGPLHDVDPDELKTLPYFKTPISSPVKWVCGVSEVASAEVDSLLLSKRINLKELRSEIFKHLEHGLLPFNTVTTTQMPTGVTSQFARVCSTGIEPLWATEFTRTFDRKDGTRGTVKLIPRSIQYLKSEGKSLKHVETALEISPKDQLAMVAAVQRFCHTSVSKTINVPNDFKVEDILETLEQAHKMGLKSVTIFRDGSLNWQILEPRSTSKKEKQQRRDDDGWVDDPPSVRQSQTWTAKGRPNLHVTVTKDSEGRPREVFIHTGKSGHVIQGLTEAMGILISNILRRHPEELELVIRAVENVDTGPNYLIKVKTEEGDEKVLVARSIPDALAKILRFEGGDDESVKQNQSASNVSGELICPNCLELTAIRTGSCLTCLSCGYSSC